MKQPEYYHQKNHDRREEYQDGREEAQILLPGSVYLQTIAKRLIVPQT